MLDEVSTFALFIAFIFGAMSLVVIALYSEIREKSYMIESPDLKPALIKLMFCTFFSSVSAKTFPC